MTRVFTWTAVLALGAALAGCPDQETSDGEGTTEAEETGERAQPRAGAARSPRSEGTGWQPVRTAYDPSPEALATTEDVISQGEDSPPNILIIWGDDIGLWNISAYNQGMMGYRTPNIDRIAREGMLFTDNYGENSCTAGRAAFITGQHPFRTGLLKVGMPGAELGLQPEDPTIADLLKPLGYNTGQFGKNHLGDLDEHLPTNHGFDEFMGNLYHLNAEEEPEHPDYPRDQAFRDRFAPRGVIHSRADGEIEDTGPLTRERMESVDREFLAGGIDFMERSVREEKPFFMWFNATRMHV